MKGIFYQTITWHVVCRDYARCEIKMAEKLKRANSYERNQHFGSFSSATKWKIIQLCRLYDCTQANLYNNMNTDMSLTCFWAEITVHCCQPPTLSCFSYENSIQHRGKCISTLKRLIVQNRENLHWFRNNETHWLRCWKDQRHCLNKIARSAYLL